LTNKRRVVIEEPPAVPNVNPDRLPKDPSDILKFCLTCPKVTQAQLLTAKILLQGRCLFMRFNVHWRMTLFIVKMQRAKLVEISLLSDLLMSTLRPVMFENSLETPDQLSAYL
jgi:hypothetical protein